MHYSNIRSIWFKQTYTPYGKAADRVLGTDSSLRIEKIPLADLSGVDHETCYSSVLATGLQMELQGLLVKSSARIQPAASADVCTSGVGQVKGSDSRRERY